MADVQTNIQLAATPVVHKFGGSSLNEADKITLVVKTIHNRVKAGDFVVVSANGPVTDLLLDWVHGRNHALSELTVYINQLLTTVLQFPQALLQKINQDLDGFTVYECNRLKNLHDILAFGELWSAQLLSAKLTEQKSPNKWLDARNVFTIDEQNYLANKAVAKSQLLKLSEQCTASNEGIVINIITGFIAQDLNGDSITLGRNGSDYTATLIANLLQSKTVFLWTDVDGVYTADPKIISQAHAIKNLTINEAQALSELGSDVLHQKTIAPILQQDIRLVINTCESNTGGTVVGRQNVNDSSAPKHSNKGVVKTLAHKGELVFLSVSALNELKARQFQARLTAAQVNNYANHFDKTQHVLSFYVEHKDLFKTTQLIKAAGLVIEFQLTGISLISAVGQNIRQNHHVITKVLNRSAQFSVHNIHYPANDHTLCVLLPDAQASALLHDLHHTFFALQPSIPIIVLGFGNIGQQFLNILKHNKSKIEADVNQSLSVVAVANSRYYQFSDDCLLDREIVLDQPNQQGELHDALAVYAGKPAVIIDLTASEWVAQQYVSFADNGWHLISANKIAAADKNWSSEIETKLKIHNRQWRKNTTVGAALPIQETIRQIKVSGDHITQVSGVFSGSLSWLFGQYDGQSGFMDWVKQAHANAFTEPDPREDLSGQDVFRKALILAQEMGVDPAEINFKAVIPEEYLSGSIEDFWHHKTAVNQYIQSIWQQAKSEQKQLRYLASVSAKELRVELVAVEHDHAAAGLKPGDNIFIVESDWYGDNPLVIQGPGAGREVTAAGVLTDLIGVLQSA